MEQDSFRITSYPYRSLGPRGYRVLFAVVIGANLFGGLVFLAMGAWPVSGFMGLDVLALYIAFRISYRQALAFERIQIRDGLISIERSDMHGNVTTDTLPSYWAHVAFDGDEEGGDVALRSHGRSVAVGRMLPGFEREMFADTLRRALAEAKRSTAEVQT
jgi:uncharacterized membrane protein